MQDILEAEILEISLYLASLYVEILDKSTDHNNPVKQQNMNKIFCVLIVLGQRYFMDKISLVFENITM
jgi:hypothetical protein